MDFHLSSYWLTKKSDYSSIGKLQLTQISLNFNTSFSNLKVRYLGKKSYEAFFCLCFGFEIFHLNQNFTSFLHMKRLYWIWLMIEKECLNFLTRFYSHLCLLQGCVCSTLEKYWLLKLDLDICFRHERFKQDALLFTLCYLFSTFLHVASTFCSIFVTFFPLLVIFCSLIVTFNSLSVTFCLFLFTLWLQYLHKKNYKIMNCLA